MLTLHLEAEDHQALAALAIKTLGIVAVEKHELNAPQAIAVSPATGGAATPAPAVTLPSPAPRAPRGKKTSPPAPVTALSTEAPVAAATAPAPRASAPAVAAPAASVLSSPAVPTVDEVRYALGEVNGAFGMPACTDLLKEYGAERVSLVPEAKRAEFIKACKAKVATKQS